MSSFLEIRDLKKRFGKIEALAGVSLAIERGELFGLLGPNGAGKTTLLSILAGLLAPDSGQVFLEGKPLRANDVPMRRRLGVVPQDLALYGEMTGRENLHFFGELYGLRGTPLADRVRDVLAAMNLSDRADNRVDTFSGGMKRRLNLGVGLLHRPTLLLLDEPTVGVDPQSRNHIFEEIRRINAEGVTVIYTSHYMEEVQALCRRVGIIDHGRLLACDSVANLLGTIPGQIRFEVAAAPPDLSARLERLPGVRVSAANNRFELACGDVKAALMGVAAALSEAGLELTHLETVEPNLEQVFLQLTGRGLRDG